MTKKDVLKKGTEIVTKCGAKDSKGNIIVPIEYDFVTKVNDNLFVATKGNINGLNYQHGTIMCTTELDGTYGVVFDDFVKDKALATEVDFYTIYGKLRMHKKILAAYVCKNDGMFIVLDENYKWSIILIDYEQQTILSGPYSDVDYIKMDDNNRFIITLNNKYEVVLFNEDNTIAERTPFSPCKPHTLAEKGFIFEANNKYGFIKYSGEIMFCAMFDKIIPKSSHLQLYKGEKIELYNYSCRQIAEDDGSVDVETYDLKDVELIILHHKNGETSLYSPNKRLVLSKDSPIQMFDEFAIVCNEGKYGLLRYNKELDEMESVFPKNFPDNGYSHMEFDYAYGNAYLVVDKKIRHNLVAFRD